MSNNFMNSILAGAALGVSKNQVPVGKGKFVDADGVKDILAVNSECASISLNLRGDDKAAISGKSLYAITKTVGAEELLGLVSAETLLAMVGSYIDTFTRDLAKVAFKEQLAEGIDYTAMTFDAPDAAKLAEMLADEFADGRSGAGVSNLSEEEIQLIYEANFLEAVAQAGQAKGIQAAQLITMHGAYRGLLTLLFSRSAKSKMRPELMQAVERFILVMPASDALDLVKARKTQIAAKQAKEANALSGLML